ncbi:hypothetical protein ACLIKD_10895 [Azonexus sp. IMCC34842]|uniref:hypothetical protein n=1 Tax=Azonexus sp. IMCC34842 TaxID=3420950 RepID=UPI003D0EC7B7
MTEQKLRASPAGRAPSPYPATLQRQALADALPYTSNAELLRQADGSSNPLTQELAARYAAALGFLHKDTLHFGGETS